MSRKLIWLAAAAVVVGAATAGAQVTNSPPVDAEQVLRVPSVDYRKDWAQLGTFSVLAEKPQDGAKELHAVYTERKNVEAYLNDGKFPDGAVFVKDLWSAKTEALPTGTASFAGGDLIGRFVMVKDAAGKLGSGARFRGRLGVGVLRRQRDGENRHRRLQGRLPELPRAGPQAGSSIPARLPAPAQVKRAPRYFSRRGLPSQLT